LRDNRPDDHLGPSSLSSKFPTDDVTDFGKRHIARQPEELPECDDECANRGDAVSSLLKYLNTNAKVIARLPPQFPPRLRVTEIQTDAGARRLR